MTLNCAIIDDEPLAVELLTSYVNRTPFLTLQEDTIVPSVPSKP